MATTVTDPSLEPHVARRSGDRADRARPRHAPPRRVAAQLGRGRVARSRRADLATMLFGRKIRTDQEIHERLDNPTALAVFASDALSSVAYATEEMLTVLLLGGGGRARVRDAACRCRSASSRCS